MWPWVWNSPLEPGGLPSGHPTEDYDCPFPHNPINANSLAGMSRPPSVQPMINWSFVLVHCRYAWLLRGLDYIGSARPMRQHFTPLYSTLQLLYFFHALLFPGHLRALEWVVIKSCWGLSTLLSLTLRTWTSQDSSSFIHRYSSQSQASLIKAQSRICLQA